jgi:raffinose/stachyose/melibiose transport system substrate-binding protein
MSRPSSARKRTAMSAVTAIAASVMSLTGISAAESAASATSKMPVVIGLQSTTPTLTNYWDEMVKQFNKDYPSYDLSVYWEPSSTDSFRAIVTTQLRSGSGPQVITSSPGPGFTGAYAKAGLLYNLTSAYAQYHWDIYPWTKSFLTKNGSSSGPLYALPWELDIIGVYYNKTIFAKYGLHPPTSFANWESEMKTLKSHGVTPLLMPAEDGWETGHYLSETLASFVGANTMHALETGKQTWDSPGVVDAINRTFVDLNKEYALPSPDGITYADATSDFAQGETAMFPTGEWDLSTLDEAVHFPMGYFSFPGPNGPGSWVGGVGDTWMMSAKSKDVQGDLTFLNFVMSDWFAKWQLTTVLDIPAHAASIAGLSLSPIWKQDYINAEASASNPNLIAPNVDVTQQSGFNTVMWNSLEGVFNGSETATTAAKNMEKAYLANPAVS